MYYAANEILEKIYNRGAKNDMSFAGWKNRAQQTRAALLELRKELDAELDGMADTWAKKVIDDKRESYAASFADVTAEAQRHILADLEEVAAAKQARFSEAMGDPGAAAVNVLSLLNMRTELSPASVARREMIPSKSRAPARSKTALSPRSLVATSTFMYPMQLKTHTSMFSSSAVSITPRIKSV